MYEIIKGYIEQFSIRGEYVFTRELFNTIILRGCISLVIILIVIYIALKVLIRKDLLSVFDIFKGIPISVWGVTLVGAIIRLIYLDKQMLTDESFTYIHYISKPFIIGITRLAAGNHLLNTALSHISCVIFGVHEWAIRLPAFISGILVIPLTYKVTRLFNSKSIIPTIFTAFSGALIHYSTNSRGYSLLILFFMMLIVHHLTTKRDSLLSAILGFLCIYSNPIGALGVFFVYLLTLGDRPARTWVWIALITAIFYIPIYVVNGAIFNNPLSDFANVYSLFDYIFYIIGEYPFFVRFVMLGMFLYGLWTRYSNLIPRLLLFMLCLLPMKSGFPPERAFIFFIPIFYIISMGGIWEK